MLDIKYIRENLEKMKQGAKDKKINFDFDALLKCDDERRTLIQQLEEVRAERKKASEEIAKLPAAERAEAAKRLGDKSAEKKLEEELEPIQSEFRRLMLLVPSPAREDVPVGKDDTENVELYTWGEVPDFGFAAKDHATLGKDLGMIDSERGVKIAGTRSYFLTGTGAMLEWAVLQFTLQSLIKKGYEAQIVPLLVKREAMEGTSYFPGGEEQAYAVGVQPGDEGTMTSDNKWLVGTAEVALTSYHGEEVLPESELPIKTCALSACFRREAGTYGKDTAGLYRVHQFHKVEQVVLCRNDVEESRRMHAEILKNAEDVVQALKIPYRVVAVCTGDMGQGQVYKNDIECWMPSRKGYGETHSCSTFYDFQARRLNIRYKDANGKMQFCHTLNNTCVASPRILIAIMENYQNADGSVTIPEVLRPYFTACGYTSDKIQK